MTSLGNLIRGLQIFEKHLGPDDLCNFGAAHDLVLGPPVDAVELTQVEVDELKRMGWSVSSEHDGWVFYT